MMMMMMRLLLALVTLLASPLGGCDAFSAALAASSRMMPPKAASPTTIASMSSRGSEDTVAAAVSEQRSSSSSSSSSSRRSVLLASLVSATAAIAGGASAAFAEAETMERGGVKLTPFNSLAFNYREGESPTVDASSLAEASVPYSEFLERLESDGVEFVEFLAPNGDAAYATFKSTASVGDGAAASDGAGSANNNNKNNNNNGQQRVRIGEGYPVEDPNGWSSPAFVIKAVAKKGVPYKFVVPGLGDSFKL